MKLVYVKFGQTFVVENFDAEHPSWDYLPDYGFKQSMGDSHAGSAKKVEKAWNDAGRPIDEESDEWKAAVTAQCVADMKVRFAKIEAGEMEVGDSDPLRALAVKMIRDNATAKKKTLPNGKTPEWRALVTATLEKNRVAIQKEYDRQKKAGLAIDIELP
jgi:hypothetical protein